MPSGRTHDRANLLVLLFLAPLSYSLTASFLTASLCVAGYLFATWVFSPDVDLRPRRGSGLLYFPLYPYSWMFRHRGISHWPLLGTLSRVLYLHALVLLGYWGLSLSAWDLLVAHKQVLSFYQNYNLIYFAVGMAAADLVHGPLDYLVSRLKRLF